MIEARSAVIGSTIGRVGAVAPNRPHRLQCSQSGKVKNRATVIIAMREKRCFKILIDYPDQRAFGLITETKGFRGRRPVFGRKNLRP